MAVDTESMEFVCKPSRIYPGETVTFYANASSDSATELTFTIYYDSRLADLSNNTHSPYTVNTTGNPGSVVQTFTYDYVGNLTGSEGTYFSALLVVKDGESSASLRVRVYVVDNMAPEFVIHPQSIINTAPNVMVNLSVKMTDYDDDPLHIVWDFGDGSPEAVNDTGNAAAGVYANQSHSWNPVIPPGTGGEGSEVYYDLTITASDDEDNDATWVSNITIIIPYNWSPEIGLSTYSLTVCVLADVVFRANASDHEGEALTWTFVFNNTGGTYHTEVYHTNATEPDALVYVNITHQFPAVDNYTVTLYVSDALPPNQYGAHNVSQKLRLKAVENTVPWCTSISVLYPTPVILFNVTTGSVEVGFYVQVLDEDKDPLTVTWTFGDGTDPVTNVTAGVSGFMSVFQAHSFMAAGYYNVSILVTDGFLGHEIVKYRVITVNSTNQGPKILSLRLSLSNGTYGMPNTDSVITLVFSDSEMDQLTVTIDFADGSDLLVVSSSDYDSSGNLTIVVNHTYSMIGEYTVVIEYTDGMIGQGTHNGVYNVGIRIKIPFVPAVRIWDWWDTTSLGLLFGAVGVVIIRALIIGMYRRRLDQYGMTYEEYTVRRKDVRTKYKLDKKNAGAALAIKVAKKGSPQTMRKEHRSELERLSSERRAKVKALRRLLGRKRVPAELIPVADEVV